MDSAGSQRIDAPIEQVWMYLADVKKVALCAPGFQSLEQVGPEHWNALVGVRIGFLKTTLNLDVTRPVMQRSDLMKIQVRGKAPGSTIELSGEMHLFAVDSLQTRMDWRAHVIVNGVLAHVGGRLMDMTAQRITEQFFSCLKTKLQDSL